ncbi:MULTISPECIES: MarR family winged helix-turn-helix transcriptional regulator [Persicobacter]|uniref:HTH marR-type domain-containing protein n=1 Tax=Persicobacter diffluens TaxID=981 RepID=A0AAN4VTL0_9BACT|nr:MarR family transcriptional regulator [Persicobacter sp. CCB-QB2]GJM59498.1 hypothetical protein PEDI_00500 [Persicobacter diffluens]
MKKEETVDYIFKATWHAISRMYNKYASSQEITTSIGYVLLNIHPTEGMPATKIAPLMGLESRSLSRLLKNMEDRGLIYRERDKYDKRSVLIFLTEEGRKKRSVSIATVKAFNHEVRDKVSEEELATFFRVSGKVNEVVDASLKKKTNLLADYQSADLK